MIVCPCDQVEMRWIALGIFDLHGREGKGIFISAPINVNGFFCESVLTEDAPGSDYHFFCTSFSFVSIASIFGQMISFNYIAKTILLMSREIRDRKRQGKTMTYLQFGNIRILFLRCPVSLSS